MSARYNPAGMVSTDHRDKKPETDGNVITELGDATIEELIDAL